MQQVVVEEKETGGASGLWVILSHALPHGLQEEKGGRVPEN